MAIAVNSSLEPKYTRHRGVGLDEHGNPWVNTYSDWNLDFEIKNGRKPVGDPFPIEYFPKKVRLVKGKRLFDFNGYIDGGATVSKRLKDAIQSIEPGVHQFVPVEVLHKDGTPYGEPFQYFVICTCLDAINPALGGVYKQEWPGFKNDPDRYRWEFQSEVGVFQKLAVFKDAVAGRAAWRDRRFSTGLFLSDELVEKMEAQKMDGSRAMQFWKEI